MKIEKKNKELVKLSYKKGTIHDEYVRKAVRNVRTGLKSFKCRFTCLAKGITLNMRKKRQKKQKGDFFWSMRLKICKKS